MEPLQVCREYKPKFGTLDNDTLLEDFQRLYGADPLYSWVGLNSPRMYAAHKAAGGLTSFYRQLGIGCERLLRLVIQDAASLSDEEIMWTFEVEKGDGSVGKLTLDAFLPLRKIAAPELVERVRFWLRCCSANLSLSDAVTNSLDGAVFEIRQGYKSADSKRQNADLRFALRAYGENLLPVMMLVSSQVNSAVQRRYHSSNLLVLVGSMSKDPTVSTFAFFREVIGYDLEAFFENNSPVIKQEVDSILAALLAAG